MFQLGAKNSYEKLVQKKLMKLTAGVNFTNILGPAKDFAKLFSTISLAL